MAKQIKSKSKTSGKDRMCLSCFLCKTRIFRDLKELIKWCEARECHCSICWKRKLKSRGKVQLYWCSRKPNNPRLFAVYDKPFIINCGFYYQGNIKGG